MQGSHTTMKALKTFTALALGLIACFLLTFLLELPSAQARQSALSLRRQHVGSSDIDCGQADSHTGLDAPSDWTTFGHDPGHTGFNDTQHQLDGFCLAWEKDLKLSFDVNRPLEQVAAISNVVVANVNSRFGNGGIIAFDAVDGTELWRFGLSGKYSINPVTIADNRVYFQQGNHYTDTYLFALDLSDGQEIWHSPFAAQWELYYAPAVADGQVFIDGGYYGGMYAFDAGGGSQAWYVNLPQYDSWTPVYSQGVVYSYVQGVFMAHDPADGAELWSLDLGWNWSTWSMNRMAVVSGTIAYMTVQSQGLSLVAVDLINKNEKWRIPNRSFSGTPAVADGKVYALDANVLRVYDCQSGQPLWSYEASSTLIGAPLVTNGNVFIASSSHTWVLDSNRPRVIWQVDRGGWLTIADDHLFIAQPNGVLAAYEGRLLVRLPAIIRGI
jgi:outer membrane protein assembly factor BamB